jgi:hypothetical protein
VAVSGARFVSPMQAPPPPLKQVCICMPISTRSLRQQTCMACVVALCCAAELHLGWHARPATMHLDCCTHHDI